MNSIQPEPAREVHKVAHDLLVWGGSSVPLPANGAPSSAGELQPDPAKDADDTPDQDWGDEEPILRRPIAGGWS